MDHCLPVQQAIEPAWQQPVMRREAGPARQQPAMQREVEPVRQQQLMHPLLIDHHWYPAAMTDESA